MGLDVYLRISNEEEFYAATDDAQHHRFNLSRRFCNFMCRQHVTPVEPELNQLGKITGIDIQPLYEMESYLDPLGLEWQLETAKTPQEREEIIRDAEETNAKLTGNIDSVLATVEGLLNKLAPITNLASLLDDGGDDTLNSIVYFADFQREAGSGETDYIDNNFGQDLRVIREFLLFAKSIGSSTVYFEYM